MSKSMLRRLALGLLLGLLVGAALALAFIVGMKRTMFGDALGAPLGYAAAALSGVLTGLVAGKPIWASGAKVEAGLKAFFGALLGAGAFFALRQWASSWSVDLSSFGAGGPAPVGQLVGASLPLVAATLGMLFELDNTGGDAKARAPAATRTRVARVNPAKARIAGGDPDEEERPSERELLRKSVKR